MSFDRSVMALLVGIGIGMSCSGEGLGSAIGSVSDTAYAAVGTECEQWEVKEQLTSDSITKGWEPFGYLLDWDYKTKIALRRCAD
jgi:hypothetical protein